MNLSGTHIALHPRLGAALAVLALLLSMTGGRAAAAPAEASDGIGALEPAVDALLVAFQEQRDTTLALFGAKYAGRLLSRDKVAAREDRQRLYEMSQKALTLRKDSEDRIVLLIGPDTWPFPIPLVRSGAVWSFNTAEGLEEILNRRIGANELHAIAACRDYIWAQRQYASKIRDASGVRKFAQRIISSDGKQDGLYWDPATAGGEESPVRTAGR